MEHQRLKAAVDGIPWPEYGWKGVSAAKFRRRWERRFHRMLGRAEKLRGKCHRRGREADIHELRVVLRRLRLFASIGSPCLGQRTARDFRRWSRDLSDAIGPVRDLDVLIEWLESPSGTGKRQRELAVRRSGIWSRARSRLVPVPRELVGALRQTGRGTGDAEPLLRHFHLIQSGLALELRSALPSALSSGARKQHDFRRSLRRLRFLREMVLSRDESLKDRWLALLVELHEALGQRQNARVVGGWLRDRRFPGKTRLLAGLRREVEESEPGLRAGLRRLVPYLEKTGN